MCYQYRPTLVAWRLHSAYSAIWSILRETALRDPSALADIRFTADSSRSIEAYMYQTCRLHCYRLSSRGPIDSAMATLRQLLRCLATCCEHDALTVIVEDPNDADITMINTSGKMKVGGSSMRLTFLALAFLASAATGQYCSINQSTMSLLSI